MKLAPRIAVALALISSAGLANASTLMMNDPTSLLIPTLMAFPDFAATPNPVNYQNNSGGMDTWYFNVGPSSLGINTLLSVYSNVAGLMATLFSCSNTLPASSCGTATKIGSGIGAGGSEFDGLLPGSYEVVVTGTPVFPLGTSPPAQYVAQERVVPLPAAVWLLLSGLVGLGVAARRRKPAAEV